MTADLFTGLCDDAAVFPPGSLPLADAVPAHLAHQQASYAGVVGGFVLAATHLDALAEVARDLPAGSLPLALVTPAPRLGAALAAVGAVRAVRLVGVEVPLLPEMVPADLGTALAAATASAGVPIFVEVPRDERRAAVIEALPRSGFFAKLRTGGVRADLYPDEGELAEAVVALARTGVPFKATAGLHHALRNTDPGTGFEQHGFLNLLVAAGAARAGAGVAQVVDLLCERDPAAVVAGVRDLGPEARQSFRSFGTCSITEPVDELVDLGLLPADHRTGGRG